MSKSFFKGAILGIIGPLAFLGGLALWIHRYTGKVPFPIERPAEGEVTIGLVYPEEVGVHWKKWEAELRPFLAGVRGLVDGLKSEYVASEEETA